MLLYLFISGYGDRSARLFGYHKHFYDDQWLLTGHYFKRWLGKPNLISFQKVCLFSSGKVKKKQVAMKVNSLLKINRTSKNQVEVQRTTVKLISPIWACLRILITLCLTWSPVILLPWILLISTLILLEISLKTLRK